MYTADELKAIVARQLARIRRGEPMDTVKRVVVRTSNPQPTEGAGTPLRLDDVSH